jgi:hypothetical protein
MFLGSGLFAKEQKASGFFLHKEKVLDKTVSVPDKYSYALSSAICRFEATKNNKNGFDVVVFAKVTVCQKFDVYRQRETTYAGLFHTKHFDKEKDYINSVYKDDQKENKYFSKTTQTELENPYEELAQVRERILHDRKANLKELRTQEYNLVKLIEAKEHECEDYINKIRAKALYKSADNCVKN